jgi:DNA protecting protein DprA
MRSNEIPAVLQLEGMKGFGPVKLNQLFDSLQRCESSLEYIIEFEESDLVDLLGFTSDEAQAFVTKRESAKRLAEQWEASDWRLVTRFDAEWPERLPKSVKPWFFVLGSLSLFKAPAIGIGGSRDATDQTLRLTHVIANRLAEQGVVVVSGGARGVDTEAHAAALAVGGKTIMVLAQGLGTYQVSSEKREAINAGNLTVVSEFAPTDGWSSFRAMQRNQTVIGLSDCFVIVQSGTKGGTLDAGQKTVRMKRPLFIVTQEGERAETFKGNELLISKGGTPLPVSQTGDVTLEQLGPLMPERTRQLSVQQALF